METEEPEYPFPFGNKAPETEDRLGPRTLTSPSACASLSTLAPVVTLVNGQPVPDKLQALQVQQGQLATLQWTVLDNSGIPYDFTACIAAGASFQLLIRESLSFGSNSPSISIIPTVVNAALGLVEADLTPAAVAFPGIYYMEWGLLNPDGSLLSSRVGYLVINRSQFGTTTGNGGSPMIAEIRLHMRDNDPADNLWLGVVEFDLAEIAACIQRPVDYWNESLPPISQRYNTKTFPFRYFWLEAIIGGLYSLAAAHYRRTHLAYQAGGLSVDDKNKFAEYQEASDKKWDAFQKWVKLKKYSLNCGAAMQSSGSPYGGRNWTY